ncbi:MAG: bifunctional phosphoribosyl-AMP cyclohydrolase/phosphoribosyl-ATP diphosphatase HisIE [Marinifilaceae bacterium]
MNRIDFDKSNGLVPAVIQDSQTLQVLMLGYMNREAFEKTLAEKRVTFYSRSKKRLWTKGEESGNFLQLIDLKVDCDGDTLLIKAQPMGPVCHKGTDTCWGESNSPEGIDFLQNLEEVIRQRRTGGDEKSYTSFLFRKGINKIAQKVGEEAVELVIEAKDSNEELFLGEAADLMYHYLVLLTAKGYNLENVVDVLRKRHR